MERSSELFGAFLKCPTKCWLQSRGETCEGNAYAQWVKGQNENYRAEGMRRLQATVPEGDRVVAPAMENLKGAKWRLAVDVVVQASAPASSSSVSLPERTPGVTPGQPADETPALRPQPEPWMLASRLHAVERLASEGRRNPAQFIPIRFIYRNKLTRDDRLLVAFDALVLSASLRRDTSLCKISHGDDHATLKIKTAGLLGKVRKLAVKMAEMLAGDSPPDLVLNRHCGECEFREQCRQKAFEKDDLSLLANMTGKERKKFNGNGIFTVAQLSYTFRPRRRPRALAGKQERYHHSLKALAIRERKIHVVGTSEFKVEGTPVYLDVEALPDRDFYYLVGTRVRTADGPVQHSFWADDREAERTLWRDFLQLLATLDNPVLIHYGSFETAFLKRMCARYGGPPAEVSGTAKAIQQSVNLLSSIFGRVYFPAFSNGLKDVAQFLGFKWSAADVSGLQSIAWRHAWETSRDSRFREMLIRYNAEDCEALERTACTVSRLTSQYPQPGRPETIELPVVQVDALKRPWANKWRTFSSPISELEFINKAAHWDYQRDRIYVRSSKRVKRAQRNTRSSSKSALNAGKVIECVTSNQCPHCGQRGTKMGPARPMTVQDILFGRFSLKRRVVRYQRQPYRCSGCHKEFGQLPKGRRCGKYGRNLIAYLFYQTIELDIPVRKVTESLGRLFGVHFKPGSIAFFKENWASCYAETQRQILERIVSGELVHVDETHITIKRRRAYVLVFTNMHEVAYVYSETREGELLRTTLGKFKGVLVSDFYAIYDSFDCPQQKCLIHLVRDLNEELLRSPYDEEFKNIAMNFGLLLKSIVEDVDRYGLKKHFLRKHLVSVDRFYRKVVGVNYQSVAAVACKERFEKNRDKLFTFLQFDGIPWNNNNAEHAIKAFARLRDFIESGATEKGIREYLILLSVCQTCKYSGLDFLDFLRSGETDIQAFAENQPRRKRHKPEQPF
jgi:predicted RecB family nuclease